MKGVRVSPGPPSKDAAGGHLDERSNDSVRSPSQRDSARARSAWHKQAPTPLRESQSSASITGSLDTETPGVAQQTSFGAVGHACACVGERFLGCRSLHTTCNYLGLLSAPPQASCGCAPHALATNLSMYCRPTFEEAHVRTRGPAQAPSK